MDELLGQKSKQFMRDLVFGKVVRCELNGKRTYDRFVGVCYLGDMDVGVAVIEAGLALDCPRYSGGKYTKYEVASTRGQILLPGYCR